jgi:hypothetical protein
MAVVGTGHTAMPVASVPCVVAIAENNAITPTTISRFISMEVNHVNFNSKLIYLKTA